AHAFWLLTPEFSLARNTMPSTINLLDHSPPFLAYLEEWCNALAPLSLAEIVAGAPERVALISIDVINGFCKSGPLASERVGRIAQPVDDLFLRTPDPHASALSL